MGNGKVLGVYFRDYVSNALPGKRDEEKKIAKSPYPDTCT